MSQQSGLCSLALEMRQETFVVSELLVLYSPLVFTFFSQKIILATQLLWCLHFHLTLTSAYMWRQSQTPPRFFCQPTWARWQAGCRTFHSVQSTLWFGGQMWGRGGGGGGAYTHGLRRRIYSILWQHLVIVLVWTNILDWYGHLESFLMTTR